MWQQYQERAAKLGQLVPQHNSPPLINSQQPINSALTINKPKTETEKGKHAIEEETKEQPKKLKVQVTPPV